MTNTFPWFNFITSLIAAFALVVSIWSLYYSHKATDISEEALKQTKDIFIVENRPYLNIKLIKFKETDSYFRFIPKDKTFHLAVQFKVSNEGKAPAVDVSVPLSSFRGVEVPGCEKSFELSPPPNITLGHGETKAYVWDNEIGYGDFNAEKIRQQIETNQLSVEVSMLLRYKSSLEDKRVYESSIAYIVKNKELILTQSKRK